MNIVKPRAHARNATALATLLGTASFLSLASAEALAAQAAAPVEEVLITGSLIAGAPAVGVPVTSLNIEDFRNTGAASISELMRNVPAVHVDLAGAATTHSKFSQRGNYIDLHLLGPTRALLMVNGMRYPLQSEGGTQMDPGIVPQLSVERIEILADGSSAIYGSDAVSGVVNIIMKRGFEGAITQFETGQSISRFGGGGLRFQAQLLYGTTWDGGDITLGYDFSDEQALDTTADRLRLQFTNDYTPWGLDNVTPVASAVPGIVSTGAPTPDIGTTCTNCYSIPRGTGWNYGDTPAHTNPTAPNSAPTTSWAILLTRAGVLNQVNPFTAASLSTPQQRNSATVTFDQRIFEGVELFVDAFYQNRRAVYHDSSVGTFGRRNQDTYVIPTNNPYRPTGAPAAIRVSYNFAVGGEVVPRTTTGELALHYAAGFNFELPFDWQGKIFYQLSQNKGWYTSTNLVNRNMASAAVGNTITIAANLAFAGSGASTFTKPANIPYLNLFCDPTTYQCNSPATLAYIVGYRVVSGINKARQWNASFNGPLFALPAGDVRAAVGLDLAASIFSYTESRNNESASTALILKPDDRFGREVPAGYVQVNVPLVGESNALPFIRRLDVEGSYRMDRYYDFGWAKSPKVGVDWEPTDGLLLRASWGRSFRAPAYPQIGISNSQIHAMNAIMGDTAGNRLRACPPGSASPVPGSPGEVLVNLGLASCSATAPLALQFPGGIAVNGGSAGAAPLRPWDGVPINSGPEKAVNTSFGFEFTPSYVPGLNIGATYWKVKVNDFMFSGSGTLAENLQNPNITFLYIFPTDPNFAAGAQGLITSPKSDIDPALVTNVKYLVDSATRNVGSFVVSGVDFRADYNLDLANWGVWRTGITGTYFIKAVTDAGFGDTTVDLFYDLSRGGVPNKPKLRWRSYLGWADESFNATVFVNYLSHYFHTQTSIPSAAVLAACTTCGPYSNYMPNFLTGDLAFGYNTLDAPTNEYLRNINVQVVINNVLDHHAPMLRQIDRFGTIDTINGHDAIGRRFTLIFTKTW
jgi:iron complex outermembrane recepter protein